MKIYIIKSKSGYISTCYFLKVGEAMKFAHDIGLEFGKYEILEISQY